MSSSLNDYERVINEWRESYEKVYGKKPEELKLFAKPEIPIKSVYSPADIENTKYDEIGMPGVYPFTRGIRPLQNQLVPFGSSIFFGFGLPEQTRELIPGIFLEDPGRYQLNFAGDQPTYTGYDPDHPVARGKVGQVGMTLSHVEDFKRLLDDVPIDKLRIVFNPSVPSPVIHALYLVYAERRGVPIGKLMGRITNRLYSVNYYGIPGFPPKASIKLMVDLIKFNARNMPEFDSLVLDGYSIAEAGANNIQELAFCLALHIDICNRVIEEGLSADEYAPHVGFKFHVDMDFFETIAKLRAFRRMWGKINKERFGCKDTRSLQARMTIQTAGRSLLAQQPLNNIIRTTIEAMAAVMAGVEGSHICAYDEAYAIPTKESRDLTVRMRDILSYETGIRNVSDPLGGSYYLESLTSTIEEKVNKKLEEIENRGGFFNYWEKGWIREEIERSYMEWVERVNRNEEILVGLNKFQYDEKIDIPVFSLPPNVEEIAIERIKNFKIRRDQRKLERSLDNVKEVARNDGEIMPTLIDAARADATLGEMMDALREVYGWQRY